MQESKIDIDDLSLEVFFCLRNDIGVALDYSITEEDGSVELIRTTDGERIYQKIRKILLKSLENEK